MQSSTGFCCSFQKTMTHAFGTSLEKNLFLEHDSVYFTCTNLIFDEMPPIFHQTCTLADGTTSALPFLEMDCPMMQGMRSQHAPLIGVPSGPRQRQHQMSHCKENFLICCSVIKWIFCILISKVEHEEMFLIFLIFQYGSIWS